jgi:hypothetical protein
MTILNMSGRKAGDQEVEDEVDQIPLNSHEQEYKV